MQRNDETRLQYLLRLKAELMLENIVEDDIRGLIDERQEEQQQKPKRGRPANNPQQQAPQRLQIGGNGNVPAFRNNPPRLPAPEREDDQP